MPAPSSAPSSDPAPAPSPVRRLAVHIGDHKTGSTSIQYAFAAGQVGLGGAAIAYPTDLNHSYLRKHLAAWGTGPTEEAERVFRRLARRIRQSGAPGALISAEALEGTDPGVLKAVLERFFTRAARETRVIAYVRPHGPRFLSNFAEQVKIGFFSGDLEAYLTHIRARERLDYAPRFAALRAAFGADFILRPMLREALKSGSVLEDFVHHAFGPEAAITPGAGAANESLSLEDLMRLKVLQSRLSAQPQKLRHAVGWEVARLAGALPAPATRTKLHLHRSLAEQIRAAYLEDARALDADFFDGKPLMEDALTEAVDSAPAEAQPLEPEAWFSAGEMRSLALYADFAASLLTEKGTNWVPVLRQRRVAALEEE